MHLSGPLKEETDVGGEDISVTRVGMHVRNYCLVIQSPNQVMAHQYVHPKHKNQAVHVGTHS